MKARVACLAACIGLSACSDGSGSCDLVESALVIKNQAGVAATTFAGGEPVSVENQIFNRSAFPARIEVVGCGTFFHGVADSSGDEWFASIDFNCPIAGCAGRQPFTLQPGEMDTSALPWELDRCGNNDPLPAGAYVVTAYDDTNCAPALDTSLTITITD